MSTFKTFSLVAPQHCVKAAVLAALLCSSIATAFPLVAEQQPSVAVSAANYQDRAMTLDQAVAMVEAKYKARALRYNTVDEDGRSIHYIRLITADRSRVFTVRVDAATGQELSQ